MSIRLVLASASPARLASLRAAGLDPEVMVSGVDETAEGSEADARALCMRLAAAKAAGVAQRLAGEPVLVVGCDSVLEFDGEVYGKPGSAELAVSHWRRMRGRSGTLHTGHCVLSTGDGSGLTKLASTRVHFADVSDAEIEAYVATGEPLQVAGAFTLDGLGGAFVTAVEGDPHTVVGISLPLLREMFAELGVAWTEMWPQHLTRPADRARER